jgi:hypothetical protein
MIVAPKVLLVIFVLLAVALVSQMGFIANITVRTWTALPTIQASDRTGLASGRSVLQDVQAVTLTADADRPESRIAVNGGMNSHREFCTVPESQKPPNRPFSQFLEVTTAEARKAAVEAIVNHDAKANKTLQAFVAKLSAEEPCFWGQYRIPNSEHPGFPNNYFLPMCTHDPAVDRTISGRIHAAHVWFQDSMYQQVAKLTPQGCPPDRPVAVDLGLNIGSWSMYALERGCHVIAFDALFINVKRVTQTVIAAKDKHGRPFIERFHGFRNGVGNTVGNVSIKVSRGNVGGSQIASYLRTGTPGTEFIQTVHLEDLFYNMPPEQRPQIRVGHQDTNGNWVYAMEPLQPKHVHIMKVDVEGYDVPALYSLRRMLEGPLREKPVAMVTEFFPGMALLKKCSGSEFVKFMYEAGYVYEDYPTSEEMLSALEASNRRVSKAPRVFEGWWFLANAVV